MQHGKYPIFEIVFLLKTRTFLQMLEYWKSKDHPPLRWWTVRRTTLFSKQTQQLLFNNIFATRRKKQKRLLYASIPSLNKYLFVQYWQIQGSSTSPMVNCTKNNTFSTKKHINNNICAARCKTTHVLKACSQVFC